MIPPNGYNVYYIRYNEIKQILMIIYATLFYDQIIIDLIDFTSINYEDSNSSGYLHDVF